MTEGAVAAGAVQETTVFLSHFEDLPDYRQKGKVAYPLDEVLLLMLAAALAGAETVADIARFGRAKLAFLRRFRPFANGTPAARRFEVNTLLGFSWQRFRGMANGSGMRWRLRSVTASWMAWSSAAASVKV